MSQPPSYAKIFFYLVVKNIAAAIVIAFVYSRYYDLVLSKAKNNHEILKLSVGYWEYVLIIGVIIPMVFFYIPTWLIFKLNKIIYVILAFILICSFEYYLWTSGQFNFDIDATTIVVMSVIFFPVFFYKFLVSLLT